MTDTDFARTAIIVLSVIGIVLMVFLRSVPVPIMVMGLLSLNYWATMYLTRLVAVGLFHDQGISWAVPFFGFLLTVGLGVDYALFYLARFREVEATVGRRGIIEAAVSSAAPIISAIAVMIGTFASLFAAGFTTLEEIATAVVIGLVLDLLLILAISLPIGLWGLYPIRHWPLPLRHLWYRAVDPR